MNRLIVFGCSYTYGHGLQDCIASNGSAPGLYPSKFAWPQLVANVANLECINQSDPGSSNQQILWQIERFDFEVNDTVIIHWSFCNRAMYRTIKNDIVKILPQYGKSKGLVLAKKYYALENQLNMYDKTRIFLNYANYRLKNIGINNFDTDDINLVHYYKKNLFPDADTALDNSHPGPKTHQRFAEYILGEYPWLKD
jgi:hypothetical protein